ncbi:MAG: fibronectin type III domain-containing protein [Lachnospiraceae bacterium]|nr:fibronectin type III domain-containing protein [Lachnospiraceae bacterium]
MKKRVFVLLLSFLITVNSSNVLVCANEVSDAEPAQAALTYEFDGMNYINVGDGNFAASQTDYYRSMLHNALNRNGANVYGSDFHYYDKDGNIVLIDSLSLEDMWTINGFNMLAECDRSDALKDNLFRVEKDYFFSYINGVDGKDLLSVTFDHDDNDTGSGIFKSVKVNPDFKSKQTDGWDIDEVDFCFFRETMRSAASTDAVAENVARTAAEQMLDTNGKSVVVPSSVPVKITGAPELKGPVFYSFIGASGKDLKHLKGAYVNHNIHGALITFSDFSITPIIPDENTKAPYAYVKTAGGTSSKDEQKIVSDVKNYSGETVTASQSITQTGSSTMTSNISGSRGTTTGDTYSVSDTVKVGAKFSLEKVFELSDEISSTISSSHSTSETVTKGWSKSEGTTESESESRTISISLPPYTTALMSQQRFDSEEQIRYNCPAALNYKVTVYYVYGNLDEGANLVDISFDKLTDFGSSGNASTDLGRRYEQGTGSSRMTDADGIRWNDVGYKFMIPVISSAIPFDTTQATFTAKINKVSTDIEDILPIYPIDAVKFMNPDGVLYNKPYLTEVNMEKGDTNYASGYVLKALNEFGAPFYTFYAPNGSYMFFDEDGNDISVSGNEVISLFKDPVSGQLKFTGTGEGTVYMRYRINNGVYKTASMAATNTPEDYIDDSEIPHPAMLQINVQNTGHEHRWLKTSYVWSDDHSTCTAYRRCKYDESHMMQETSDAQKEIVEEASCIKDGTTIYTASFETDGFEPQTITVKEAATGHKFGEWATTAAPTELDEGQRSRVCEVCGATETTVISRLDATLPTVEIAGPRVTKKKVTIKWNKLSKAEKKLIDSIQVQYSEDKNFENDVNTVTAGKKSRSVKLRGLKSGTRYYVRVRAYKAGSDAGHVSKWSGIAVFTTK